MCRTELEIELIRLIREEPHDDLKRCQHWSYAGKGSRQRTHLLTLSLVLVLLLTLQSSEASQHNGSRAPRDTGGGQPPEEQKEGLRPQCSGMLRWVPPIIKTPYTTLLNSAHCPSWMTRHLMTKFTQNTYLKLPRGVPFALLCGLCHKPNSDLDSNVTLQHGDEMIAQVSIPSSNGVPQHYQRGQQCYIQYGITGPLTSSSSGTVTCTAHYGKLTLTEAASYYVYDVPIVSTQEILDVPGSTVVLTCPAYPDEGGDSVGNPLVHVWYYPLATGPRVAAPTTNPTVTFRLATAEPLVVSCATYHIISITRVVVTTFTVKRSQSYQLQGEAILERRGYRGQSRDNFPSLASSSNTNSDVWDGKEKYGPYGEVRGSGGGHLVEEGEAAPDGVVSMTAATWFNFSTALVAIVSAAATVFVVAAVVGCFRVMRGVRGGGRVREVRRHLHGLGTGRDTSDARCGHDGASF